MLDSLLPLTQQLLPLAFLLGALPGTRRWQRAVVINAAIALAVLAIALGLPLVATLAGLEIAQTTLSHGPSTPGLAITVLVGLLGAVIARFSANYLQGEQGRERFLTFLQITLAGVVCVVMTDHLLLLWLGWVVISLSLHRLLLFYPDRPRAVLAAHKKFLLARLAETLLMLAAGLLYWDYQTLQISELRAAFIDAPIALPSQFAAVLIALVAMIKCAQLPVHGWLIQVVEAPTPVSALLHAGVINLGGYLLIVFGPLLEAVPAARWLVLVVSGLTLVLAALIMMQQTSVKVRLAWSTSAQMGLMLVQCALGFYTLALLHLVAHACYKAYSFLAAGSAVQVQSWRRMSPKVEPQLGQLAVPILLLAAVCAGAWVSLGSDGLVSSWTILLALLSTVFVERWSSAKGFSLVSVAGLLVVLTAAFFAQKWAVSSLFAGLDRTPSRMADLWLTLLLLTMTAAYWLLRLRADLRWTRALAAKLFAGLYLDEWFTRVTLALWPLQLPQQNRRAELAAPTREAL